jgi:hypothetical protein
MDVELIWKFFVAFMLFGIAGRVFFMHRELNEFHDCFQDMESRIFSKTPTTDGSSSARVLTLEEFITEFGFDPRHSTESDNSAAVAEWDNANN